MIYDYKIVVIQFPITQTLLLPLKAVDCLRTEDRVKKKQFLLDRIKPVCEDYEVFQYYDMTIKQFQISSHSVA